MELSRDFSDLFRAFSSARVEYLVVGAHALGALRNNAFEDRADHQIRPLPSGFFAAALSVWCLPTDCSTCWMYPGRLV
jgi:hypothetical protein